MASYIPEEDYKEYSAFMGGGGMRHDRPVMSAVGLEGENEGTKKSDESTQQQRLLIHQESPWKQKKHPPVINPFLNQITFYGGRGVWSHQGGGVTGDDSGIDGGHLATMGREAPQKGGPPKKSEPRDRH